MWLIRSCLAARTGRKQTIERGKSPRRLVPKLHSLNGPFKKLFPKNKLNLVDNNRNRSDHRRVKPKIPLPPNFINYSLKRE